MASDGCSLYQETARLSESCGSLYRDTIPGRDALLEFMDMNEWFGHVPVFQGRDVFVDSVDDFREQLELWLRAYKKTGDEKIKLMLEAYDEVLPDTCDRISAFILDPSIKRPKCAYKMVDFILSTATRELVLYTQEELDELISEGNKEMTLVLMKLFDAFMNYEYKGIRLSTWNYRFESHQLVKQNREAYSLNQFAGMACAVFDQRFWEEQNLIEKACSRRRYADLWLYTAMLFMGAIRCGDYKRLPIPELPYEGNEVRRKIIEGEYTDKEARMVTEEFLFRLQMLPRKPHKRRRYQWTSTLKIQIPESLRQPMGVIMSISLSFREKDDPFVGTASDPVDVKSFFGDKFAEQVTVKIHSRRANKSYLQGIAVEGDDETGRPKGYMLASLARSHKCSLGGLSDVTDIYLQDAAFTGYTPEFILLEMFERGIFGFIPALLLEMYAGKEFLRIGVSSQTKLIQILGLSAMQIEEVTETVMTSFHRAGEVVETAMNGKDQRTIGVVMQRIASGAAPAKTDKSLCLMTAAGHGCVEPTRSGCMGCRYEIYTKSSVHLLMREYRELCIKLESSEGAERDRMRKLLKKGVIPCISEVLASIQMMYPDADMESILKVTERGHLIEDAAERNK